MTKEIYAITVKKMVKVKKKNPCFFYTFTLFSLLQNF